MTKITTKQQAIEALSFHSASHSDITDIRWQQGFLGMLRPYQGKLYEENFHEIMQCIYILKNDFTQSELSKKLISALWNISFFNTYWGIDEKGMLQSNHLLSKEETERLKDWINMISYAVFCLLEGSEEEAFEEYAYSYPNYFTAWRNLS